MKTVILDREKIHCGALRLVNMHHPIQGDGACGLMAVDLCYPDILMRRDAANVMKYILEKIAAGNAIVPVSGYRSFQEQTAIYDSSVRENGEAFTRKYVALPGCSEHQTGLAIDLGMRKHKIDFLCPDFPYDGICGRFRRIAPDYGFIERYARDKEALTGIACEPWHFRYVGYPHSKIITEHGFSLEEYIEFIKEYQETRRLVWPQGQRSGVEVYYAPADGPKTPISAPEEGACQISGNNVDGFIVTVWKNL